MATEDKHKAPLHAPCDSNDVSLGNTRRKTADKWQPTSDVRGVASYAVKVQGEKIYFQIDFSISTKKERKKARVN